MAMILKNSEKSKWLLRIQGIPGGSKGSQRIQGDSRRFRGVQGDPEISGNSERFQQILRSLSGLKGRLETKMRKKINIEWFRVKVSTRVAVD